MDRQTLLKTRELPRERVTVPELGEVWVRTLTAGERDEYEQECFHARAASTNDHVPNARARLLVRTLCDARGQALLTPADVDALGAQPIHVIQPLYNVAARLNALTQQDREELEKN